MSSNTTIDEPRDIAPARALHRWAVLIVCLVWPLIWIGGLVTTYDAGMAVPDWPGTYGKNLFLYPYQTWLLGPFDLFIEHGHRLLAAIVGFLAIIAFAVAVMTEPRKWVKYLSLGLLLAVICQGALGGARVVLSDRTLAMAHGCTGPLFFVICVALAVVTSRWWWNQAAAQSRGATVAPTKTQLRLTTTIVVLSFCQLLLGAQLRHVLPTASPSGFTHLVYSHIAGAFGLWGLTFALALHQVRRKAGCGDLTLLRPGYLLVGFVGIQIGLGLATWVANYGWPYFAQFGPFSAGYLVKSKAFVEAIVTTAHVATGSLILAVSVTLWLRLMKQRLQVS